MRSIGDRSMAWSCVVRDSAWGGLRREVHHPFFSFSMCLGQAGIGMVLTDNEPGMQTRPVKDKRSERCVGIAEAQAHWKSVASRIVALLFLWVISTTNHEWISQREYSLTRWVAPPVFSVNSDSEITPGRHGTWLWMFISMISWSATLSTYAQAASAIHSCGSVSRALSSWQASMTPWIWSRSSLVWAPVCSSKPSCAARDVFCEMREDRALTLAWVSLGVVIALVNWPKSCN